MRRPIQRSGNQSAGRGACLLRIALVPALTIVGAVLVCSFWMKPALAQSIRQDLYVTDGIVSSAAVSGNTLYVGGVFTRVGPATGADSVEPCVLIMD